MGKYGPVVLGVGIIVVVMVYQRVFGVSNGFEYVLLRGLFAIGGGYAANGLIGNFGLDNKIVNATGGFGVAALLYLFNPVGTVAVLSAPAEKRADLQSVDSLLSQPAATGAPIAPAVDSIARSLGYSNYENFRVLATPNAARELRHRAVVYRARRRPEILAPPLNP